MNTPTAHCCGRDWVNGYQQPNIWAPVSVASYPGWWGETFMWPGPWGYKATVQTLYYKQHPMAACHHVCGYSNLS